MTCFLKLVSLFFFIVLFTKTKAKITRRSDQRESLYNIAEWSAEVRHCNVLAWRYLLHRFRSLHILALLLGGVRLAKRNDDVYVFELVGTISHEYTDVPHSDKSYTLRSTTIQKSLASGSRSEHVECFFTSSKVNCATLQSPFFGFGPKTPVKIRRYIEWTPCVASRTSIVSWVSLLWFVVFRLLRLCVFWERRDEVEIVKCRPQKCQRDNDDKVEVESESRSPTAVHGDGVGERAWWVNKKENIFSENYR